MIFCYYFLAWVLYLILAPFILLLSFFKQKYKKSLKARFFCYKNLTQSVADVHFHACSYGEVMAIRDLSLKFNSRISVITNTGFDLAKSFNQNTNFLPFEIFLPFWFKPCKVLVIFEAEYWLILLFMAKFHKAKVILLNARISDKSYKKYLKFAFFYKKIFSFIDEVFAQSALDKTRLESLGAKNVKICKNIKASLRPKLSKNYTKLKERLIILASTHKNEEKLLLENINLNENEKLIIAPRHPERFEEVKNLLKSLNLAFNNFSEIENLSEFKEKILLLDTLGELNNFYAISDVVVLGGSFIKGIGGHNPIEAASFQNLIITGEFIDNQKALFNEVRNFIINKDLRELNEQIHNTTFISKVRKNESLSEIVELIRKEVNARESL